jgi:hypothetical protein
MSAAGSRAQSCLTSVPPFSSQATYPDVIAAAFMAASSLDPVRASVVADGVTLAPFAAVTLFFAFARGATGAGALIGAWIRRRVPDAAIRMR